MGETGVSGSSTPLVPRSKYLAFVAVVALCVSLVALADVFTLPFSSTIGAAASSGSVFSMTLLNSYLDTGYAGLFVLMALESSAFPIPSEVVLPLAGYLVFLGRMNLTLAIIDATAAGLAGSLVDYYVALRLGRPIVYGILGKLGVSAKRIDDGERWVDSKGAWSVLVGRLIPGVRSVISIPAGLLRMKVWPFVVLTVLGSFVWSAVLVYVGYSAGALWQSALDSFTRYADQLGLALVAAGSAAYVLYYLRAFGRRG